MKHLTHSDKEKIISDSVKEAGVFLMAAFEACSLKEGITSTLEFESGQFEISFKPKSFKSHAAESKISELKGWISALDHLKLLEAYGARTKTTINTMIELADNAIEHLSNPNQNDNTYSRK